MRIIAETGREDIAMVYVGETRKGKYIEFTESLQPPLPKEEKWILTVSTLQGCPVRCLFCDAGGFYKGILTKDEIISQIDYLITKRYPDKKVPVKKFKIQFARMGEPSFNHNVLDVLECLPELYDAPGLIPSFSTVAPANTDVFFEKLLEIKNKKYARNFQLQFSIHSTDEHARDWLIPTKKWNLEKIAAYGRRFANGGVKKITLNFALAEGIPVDPIPLLKCFSTDTFLIKITPVNPTLQAAINRISSLVRHPNGERIISDLRKAGYEVILSIGELEENQIGSNCGMYIAAYEKTRQLISGSYTYELKRLS